MASLTSTSFVLCRMSILYFIFWSGDSLTYHLGQNFSTPDQDNDAYAEGSCSVTSKGGWWYKACQESNLNGIYYQRADHPREDGVIWHLFYGYHQSHHYPLRFSEMKLASVDDQTDAVASQWLNSNRGNKNIFTEHEIVIAPMIAALFDGAVKFLNFILWKYWTKVKTVIGRHVLRL
jgi:Fibrinogen beta and gamma chains, C-terminal globular domain